MWGGFLEAVSEGVVSGAVTEDVFSCLGGFTAGGFILTIEREALSEFTCVAHHGRFDIVAFCRTVPDCSSEHKSGVLYSKRGGDGWLLQNNL